MFNCSWSEQLHAARHYGYSTVLIIFLLNVLASTARMQLDMISALSMLHLYLAKFYK